MVWCVVVCGVVVCHCAALYLGHQCLCRAASLPAHVGFELLGAAPTHLAPVRQREQLRQGVVWVVAAQLPHEACEHVLEAPTACTTATAAVAATAAAVAAVAAAPQPREYLVRQRDELVAGDLARHLLLYEGVDVWLAVVGEPQVHHPEHDVEVGVGRYLRGHGRGQYVNSK